MYEGKDFMEKISESLQEHAMNIIKIKQKKSNY